MEGVVVDGDGGVEMVTVVAFVAIGVVVGVVAIGVVVGVVTIGVVVGVVTIGIVVGMIGSVVETSGRVKIGTWVVYPGAQTSEHWPLS